MQQASREGGGEVSNKNETLGVICFLLIFVFLLCVSFYKGGTEGRRLKTEAVQRGFATWVSDENGNTTFTWKEPNP